MANVDLKQLVHEAEAAVAGVKDPNLKRAGFEKILERLLSAGTSATKVSTGTAKAKPAPRGPQGYIEDMIAEGFFKKPQTIGQVQTELANRGHHIPLTGLSGPLRRLCTQKKLRRQKGVTAGKNTYGYTEW
jgi:hypothetical protein